MTPEVVSSPANAKIAYTRNEMIAIGLWKLAFGERKRLFVPEMLSANTRGT